MRGAAEICLPKTNFCFGLFQGEKYTFFQKFSKIGLVAEKLMITFRGGGSDTKVIKITFFFYFLFEPFAFPKSFFGNLYFWNVLEHEVKVDSKPCKIKKWEPVPMSTCSCIPKVKVNFPPPSNINLKSSARNFFLTMSDYKKLCHLWCLLYSVN